ADPDDDALLVGKRFIGFGHRRQFVPENARTVLVTIGRAEHPIDRRLAFEVLKGGPHEESGQNQQQASNETRCNSLRDRFWHGPSLHPNNPQPRWARRLCRLCDRPEEAFAPSEWLVYPTGLCNITRSAPPRGDHCSHSALAAKSTECQGDSPCSRSLSVPSQLFQLSVCPHGA